MKNSTPTLLERKLIKPFFMKGERKKSTGKKGRGHFLIFEGAELSGKSFIMSQIYNFLEKKYNQSKVILDGCRWFNADVGILGTPESSGALPAYIELFKSVGNNNILVEKFHISDIVYKKIFFHSTIRHDTLEMKLLKMNAKIILLTFPEDQKILEKRLSDRLSLYAHYKRIAKNPAWYIQQQKMYIQVIQKSKLPHLIIRIDKLPDEQAVDTILQWIGEQPV